MARNSSPTDLQKKILNQVDQAVQKRTEWRQQQATASPAVSSSPNPLSSPSETKTSLTQVPNPEPLRLVGNWAGGRLALTQVDQYQYSLGIYLSLTEWLVIDAAVLIGLVGLLAQIYFANKKSA